MILISTIGKNLDKLSQFIDDEYDEIYFLISANELNIKFQLQKKINDVFKKTIKFEFTKNLIEVETDDINDVFSNAIRIIQKFADKSKIIVNPTGGSTAMRIGLYRAGVLTDTKIKILTGDRDANHQLYNARHEDINRELIIFYENFITVKEEFNLFNYNNAKIIFDEKFNDRKIYDLSKSIFSLSKFFDDWDNFKFEDIKNQYDNKFFNPETKKYLTKFKSKSNQLLSTIKEKNNINPVWIPEFWNSALRSYKKKQYPEAFLKIMRFLESITQNILLFTLNKNVSDIKDRMTFETSLNFLHERKKHIDNKLLISHYFIINIEELKNIAKMRNESIFAHGYKNIMQNDVKFRIQTFEKELLPLLEQQEITKKNLGQPLDFLQLPSKFEEIGINIEQLFE